MGDRTYWRAWLFVMSMLAACDVDAPPPRVDATMEAVDAVDDVAGDDGADVSDVAREAGRDVMTDVQPMYATEELPLRRIFVTSQGALFATARDGSFWAWGRNYRCGLQPCVPSQITWQVLPRPQRMPGVRGVVAVSFGPAYCALGEAGRGLGVFCWGAAAPARWRQEGENWDDWRYPHRVGTHDDLRGLSGSEAVRSDGYRWSIRNGEPWERFTTPLETAGRVVGIASFADMTADGVMSAEGLDDVVDTRFHRIADPVAIAGDAFHTCVLRANGRVLCWGLNDFGGAGNYDLMEPCGAPERPDGGFGPALGRWCVRRPTEVPGLEDAVQVAVGESETCARRRDGTVWCWGRNVALDDGLGSLGDGLPPGDEFCQGIVSREPCRRRPVQVQGLTDVVDVSYSNGKGCAIRSDGSAWCWGLRAGVFGGATTQDSGRPLRVRWR